MKSGDLVRWCGNGSEEYLLLTFLRFTHWGGIYGEFLFPDGSRRELGMWGFEIVRSLDEEEKNKGG